MVLSAIQKMRSELEKKDAEQDGRLNHFIEVQTCYNDKVRILTLARLLCIG